MRKLLIAFVLCLVPSFTLAYGTCGTGEGCPTTSGQTEWTAASASYANVNYCVNTCATYGDTVNVPDTSDDWEVWSSPLIINKYVTLSGAGNAAGGTWIKQGINNTLYGLIEYRPDQYSYQYDGGDGGSFRITGFKFDGTATAECGRYTSSKGIRLVLSNLTSYYTNLRIDNNSFYNFYVYYQTCPTSGIDPNYYGYAIHVDGLWGGVVDSNIFNSCVTASLGSYSSNVAGYGWNLKSQAYGTKYAIYFEDNLVENYIGMMNSGHGTRWVVRANSFPTWNSSVLTGFLDLHGNMQKCCETTSSPAFVPTNNTGQVRGGCLAEGYLNKIDAGRSIANRTNVWGQRGGNTVFWGNQMNIGRPTMVSLSEEDAAYFFKIVPIVVSRNNVNYECIADHTSGSTNEPGVGAQWATYWKTDPYQTVRVYAWATGKYYRATSGYDAVQNSYFWNNTNIHASGSFSVQKNNVCSGDYCSGDLILFNRDMWKQEDNFTGSSGVGSGLRADRPATCTTGTAYWSADQGAWNTSAGTSGQHNPLGYISQGVLDKCTSTNTWTNAWYTPLTYPHPLRAGGGGATPDCGDDPTLCLNQGTCEAAGWYWYNDQCNAVPEVTCSTDPDYCLTEETCEAASWYWYDSDCYAEDQPSCRVGYYYECETEETCEALSPAGIWEVETPTSDSQIPTGYDYSGGGWTAVGADSTYQAIDDAVGSPNDDDYIYNTGTQVIRFTYSRSTTITSVTSIDIAVRAKMSAGTGKLRPHLRIADSSTGTGSNYYGSYIDLTTAYQTFSFNWTTNPKTGVAWTVNDLEYDSTAALHAFGVNVTDVAGGQAQVSQIYIVIYGDIAGCSAPEPPAPSTPGNFSLSGGTVSGSVIK